MESKLGAPVVQQMSLNPSVSDSYWFGHWSPKIKLDTEQLN